MCNTIGVDILTKCHKEYERRVCRRGEASSGKLFTLPFLRKIKISHTPHKNSKYDSSQKIRPDPPESRDICGRKISKFATRKHGADSSRDGRSRILHRQSPTGAQRGNAWQKNTGWCQRRQAQGNSWRPLSIWLLSHHTCQKHRLLAEHMGYYGNQYINISYRILWFFVRTLWCYPYQPSKDIRRLLSLILHTPGTYLHPRKTHRCMSQQIAWRALLPISTSLPLSLRTWKNPHTPGTQKIRGGVTPGGWKYRINDMTSSSGDYGKSRLTP